MKTLSKQQIEAIASKFMDELHIGKPSREDQVEALSEFQKAWDDFTESDDFRVLIKYNVKVCLNMIIGKIEIGQFEYRPNNTYKSILELQVGNGHGTNGIGVYPIKGIITKEKLIQEIILAQMESADLNTLIEKVRERCK